MEATNNINTAYINIADYKPLEHEKEKASNSYLMSLLAIMVGLPLPIINLLATFIFFVANRKSTPFVKWHCTQALLSQVTMFIINAFAFSWTLRIIFGSLYITDSYIAYIITAFMFNAFEFIITIIAAIKVRKGKHMQWWFWGAVTNKLSGRTVPVKTKYHV